MLKEFTKHYKRIDDDRACRRVNSKCVEVDTMIGLIVEESLPQKKKMVDVGHKDNNRKRTLGPGSPGRAEKLEAYCRSVEKENWIRIWERTEERTEKVVALIEKVNQFVVAGRHRGPQPRRRNIYIENLHVSTHAMEVERVLTENGFKVTKVEEKMERGGGEKTSLRIFSQQRHRLKKFWVKACKLEDTSLM